MTMYFRMGDRGPPVIRMVLESKGWKELTDDDEENTCWNILWKCGRFKPSEYVSALPMQKLNHFPKSGMIARKDSLLRHLRKLKAVYGSVYNFFPVSFILPSEYTKFVHHYSEQESKCVWICKPADLSRGRKIFLMRDISELTYDSQFVIQKYLSNPHLIAGYKWDLRVYVLITSFHPLKIYVYDEGLVRFSTEKYDMDSLDNKFSHLTNSSINKLSPSLETEKEGIGAGCKWMFQRLKEYFKAQNIDDSKLWPRIENIINLTVLNLTTTVPRMDCCFELFGFDILVDDALKPWLIEVNSSPALALDGPIDVEVKTALINDITDLLDLSPLSVSHRKVVMKAPRPAVPSSAGTVSKRPPVPLSKTTSVRSSSPSAGNRMNRTDRTSSFGRAGRSSEVTSSITVAEKRSGRSLSTPPQSQSRVKEESRSKPPRQSTAATVPEATELSMNQLNIESETSAAVPCETKRAEQRPNKFRLIFPFNATTTRLSTHLDSLLLTEPTSRLIHESIRSIIGEIRTRELSLRRESELAETDTKETVDIDTLPEQDLQAADDI
eukprot:GILJ01010255.1.p1 GENE.GILJ01010255.1~~GILJ01010255.1.p1  ORF type:complete len:570 (-),score=77.68 GILJ01010255.1:113-1771(-)